jgi:hypothetical protein
VIAVGLHAEDAIPEALEFVDFARPSKVIRIPLSKERQRQTRSRSDFANVPGVGLMYLLCGITGANEPATLNHQNIQSYRPGALITESYGVRVSGLLAQRQAATDVFEQVPSVWFKYSEMGGGLGQNSDMDDLLIDASSGIACLSRYRTNSTWPPIPESERLDDALITTGWNQSVAVIQAVGSGARGLLICDSKSKRWRIVGPPIPRKYFFTVKTLGEWASFAPAVAVTEAELEAARNLLAQRQKQLRKFRETDPAAKLDMTGIDLSFRRPAGDIYLYNAFTQKTYTLGRSGEDVELLMVDNGSVYWRHADRLMKSRLLENRLGEPEVLAQAAAIRSVHWAFLQK